MSLPSKFIVFLDRTFSGHNHDYSMLKQEFPPDGDWFSDIHVRVDLGYQGMQSDYNELVASFANHPNLLKYKEKRPVWAK